MPLFSCREAHENIRFAPRTPCIARLSAAFNPIRGGLCPLELPPPARWKDCTHSGVYRHADWGGRRGGKGLFCGRGFPAAEGLRKKSGARGFCRLRQKWGGVFVQDGEKTAGRGFLIVFHCKETISVVQYGRSVRKLTKTPRRGMGASLRRGRRNDTFARRKNHETGTGENGGHRPRPRL